MEERVSEKVNPYSSPGFYLADCMEGMRNFPDKYFDLAIVDPPYGDALDGAGGGTTGSAGSSASTNRWQRFGQRFDRYKLDEVQPCRTTGKIRPDRGGGGRPFANRRNLGR